MNMKTSIVHCGRDEYDVYIGRPSIWGNPFSHKPSCLAETKVATRYEAIDKYREWIKTQPDLMASLEDLRGKRLGCWCRPKLCHGDVLLELLGESV